MTGKKKRKIFPAQSHYVIKKRELKIWIYTHGHTQVEIAHKLGLSEQEFKWMLKYKIPFDYKQIRKLVFMMGAYNAFFVIYFPTYKMRCWVWRKVFGKRRKKEVKNGRKQQHKKPKRGNTNNANERLNC